MKDVDGLSCHIDPLIHRCLVQVYHMRANDNAQRPLAYCHDTLPFVLTHVVSLSPTQLLSQSHLPFFLRFPFIIILPLILLQRQLYNQVLP